MSLPVGWHLTVWFDLSFGWVIQCHRSDLLEMTDAMRVMPEMSDVGNEPRQKSHTQGEQCCEYEGGETILMHHELILTLALTLTRIVLST